MKQKQTKLNGEIDNTTLIVGDFNTLFSIMDRPTRQKITKETEDLNNTKPTRTDICRILHPK